GGGCSPITSSSSAFATNKQVDDCATPAKKGERSVFATIYCANPDLLRQLLTALCQTAMDQAPEDPLYLAFAHIMAKICVLEQEEEEQKQRLLFEQNRLSDRSAAEMVLLELAASKGEATLVAMATVELGMAILLEGNASVQNRMLAYLAEKRLTGLFTSLAGLMQDCSVLDLDTFERSIFVLVSTNKDKSDVERLKDWQ
ncbi:unnamed protein product, partial [Taenia asiatica]|uniref:Coatomer subunit epsilon n=1 Tax=Taenia asiatica TaxID=60517 RepID=A0A0R3W0L2_TAEAS